MRIVLFFKILSNITKIK